MQPSVPRATPASDEGEQGWSDSPPSAAEQSGVHAALTPGEEPESSWGTMLSDARRYLLLGAWWLVVFPSVAIAIAVLSFNLMGDALRDALDPRARSSVGETITENATERELFVERA